MGKVTIRHKIVGLECLFDISVVNTYRNSHQHVLRSFSDLSIEAKKVRTLKRFETEVIVIEISIVIDMIVQHFCIFHNDVVNFLRDEWSMFL